MTAAAELVRALGHRFERPELLEQALTHASFAHESGADDNERLEFLGDAVLQHCCSALLVERFPEAREGELSRMRASLVNARFLAQLGRGLGIAGALRLGRGEETGGGRDRTSILADAVEAVLGAAYLDGGFSVAMQLVSEWLGPQLAALEEQGRHGWKDPKSRLQERTQRLGAGTPVYRVRRTTGPAHDPVFEVEVHLGGTSIGTGEGGSKREAAMAAALHALSGLESES